MVKLTIVEGCMCYLEYRGFLFGPFPRNSGTRKEQTFSWRMLTDHLVDESSLYGQNNCTHWHTDATLRVDQYKPAEVLFTPKTGYPDAVTMLSKLNGTTSSYSALAVRGQFTGGGLLRKEVSGTSRFYYAVSKDPNVDRYAVTLLGLSKYGSSYISSWDKFEFAPPIFETGKSCILKVQRSILSFKLPGSNVFRGDVDSVSYDTVRFYPELTTGTISVSESSVSSNWYEPSRLIINPTNPDILIPLINARLAFVPEMIKFPGELKHYGDLANSAVSGLDAVQMNMISFLRELPEVSSLIPKLKNLRKLRSLKNAALDASDAFLTAKYGWMPTSSDLQEIWHAMTKYVPITDRNGFRNTSARSIATAVVSPTETFTATQCIKLAIGVEDNLFITLLERLEYIGLFPSLNSLWDLVPYSFVLDWFIDLGDLLERVDTRLRLLRLDIKYVTSSRKILRSKIFLPDAELPFVGDVNWVSYHRWTSSLCPVPPLSLQTNLLPVSHWLEGSALLLQRMR